MLNKIIFIFLILSALGQFSAQRRTTTVKSYYRKDGTFVNSHKRHYNSGSGSYSYSTYENSPKDSIHSSSLKMNSPENNEFQKLLLIIRVKKFLQQNYLLFLIQKKIL